MKTATVVRLIPWLEERRNFFVAQAPEFRDGDFIISQCHGFLTPLREAVYVGRRAGYVAIQSRWNDTVTIVVTQEAWRRFAAAARAGQFDVASFMDHVVEVANVGGEIAVRMSEQVSGEKDVLPFSKKGWGAFIEGIKEGWFAEQRLPV